MSVSEDSYQTTSIPSAANNMTGTTVLTGASHFVDRSSRMSFQAVWTGTPNGTFSFEVSNDPVGVGETVTNWTTLTEPSTFTSGDPAGSPTSFLFELVECSFRWIRIKYTNASSTGTLFVLFQAKP